MARQKSRARSSTVNSNRIKKDEYISNKNMVAEGQINNVKNDPANSIMQKQEVKITKIHNLQKIQPFNFTDIMFGRKQDVRGAPLNVPVGFTTSIPYSSGINATILVNPAPISVTQMWSVVMSDPVVFGCILYLITSIQSRIGDYCNPDSKITQKIVRNTFKRIGKRKLLRGLLTSIWAGYADIRLYWDEKKGEINKIQILPPNSVLLCVTPEGDLDPETGVIQYYYNISTPYLQNSNNYSQYGNAPYASLSSPMIPERQMAINPLYGTALPSDYVLHHAHNPIGLDGNLCGTSMIQSIYASVVNKANQLERMGLASTFKASPMIMFLTDTNTTVDYGNGKFASMKQNVEDNVADGLASGVFVIEGKNAVDIKTIDNTADLEKMASLVYLYNDEIRNGLVTPNLVGNSGSYANAVANSEANSNIIDYLTEGIIETLDVLVAKIIKHGVDDKDKIENPGHFELLDNSIEERAMWSKVLEMSKNLGVINPDSLDDLNFIRGKMGLKPNDKEDKELMKFFKDTLNADISKKDNVNLNKTKQDLGKKYANGGAKAITKGKNATK
jgi:hypothetical protein